MDAIIQWATILSPIIAVGMAWWTIRSSAKDTAKEVESLRKLANLQVEELALELEIELKKHQVAAEQAAEERADMNAVISCNQDVFRKMALERYEANKPNRDAKYLAKYIDELRELNRKLSKIKQQIN